MHSLLRTSSLVTLGLAALFIDSACAHEREKRWDGNDWRDDAIQVGERPFYLIDGMDDGVLKNKLQKCADEPVKRTDFSIAHRGAPLQFPEHTLESYTAAARMGAGIVECDVTFTSDGALVCRHAQNDLHTTTNILTSPLASSCKVPFAPATLGATGAVTKAAAAECRTSELTLDQFKSLKGKMDASNSAATTAAAYQGGTLNWRTDLYTGRGTLMTFRESIALNRKLGVKHTPELKAGDPATIAAVFGSQERYAQKLIDDLQSGGVRPKDAWPQSFNPNDVLYWVRNTAYGQQAVFLVDYDAAKDDILLFDTTGKQLVTRDEQLAFFRSLRRAGVKIIAPSIPGLLAVSGDRVVPSQLARDLKNLGFDLITWSFERADLRKGAATAGSYYDFDATGAAIRKDSDMYKALDVLAREVKVIGVFSDWPATVSYYASCLNLK
ncbi:MAG: glycerophosphodiester phosphodiesterase family protein [Steroidobacteraceae bacterium]